MMFKMMDLRGLDVEPNQTFQRHTGQACHVEQTTRMESLRMARSAEVGPRHHGAIHGHGRGFEGANDWPGKYEGIRRPGIDETPLSWAEVRHWQREAR